MVVALETKEGCWDHSSHLEAHNLLHPKVDQSPWHKRGIELALYYQYHKIVISDKVRRWCCRCSNNSVSTRTEEFRIYISYLMKGCCKCPDMLARISAVSKTDTFNIVTIDLLRLTLTKCIWGLVLISNNLPTDLTVWNSMCMKSYRWTTGTIDTNST